MRQRLGLSIVSQHGQLDAAIQHGSTRDPASIYKMEGDAVALCQPPATSAHMHSRPYTPVHTHACLKTDRVTWALVLLTMRPQVAVSTTLPQVCHL